MTRDASRLSYQNIAEGPFRDHSEDTLQSEISRDEALTVLQNWMRVATYNLPRRDVVDMMQEQAIQLGNE